MTDIYEESGAVIDCKHINPYLTDGEDYFVETRSVPLYDVPKMRFGSIHMTSGRYDIMAFAA